MCAALAGCTASASGAGPPPGGGSAAPPPPDEEPLVVPHFAAEDPRVGTAGFVRETTRVNETRGETTFTLMVFAVGDRLTLGAMVRGQYNGTAVWAVGDRSFSVPLDRSNRGRTDIAVDGVPGGGRHGGFDDYDWVNVEVPLAVWLSDGTRVRLTYEVPGADVVVIPGPDRWFRAIMSAR